MKIYFMGICGTAMGNAALLARASGHEVIGSDSGVYPPMSIVLAEAGIALHEGYDAKRLETLAPDLVVIGNAMSRGNPEVEWLLETKAFAFTSLPAMLHDLILKQRRNLVICGTHGKTTTTSLTAFLLRETGRDPGFLIGGVPQDPPTGSHLGTERLFVIEGDEYDSAFFDKRSKFIHYAPHIVVLNNLEFDHVDIFRDLADVQRTFVHLTRIVPRNGCIIINGDDANLRPLGPMAWTRVVRVGLGENNDLRVVDFAESATGAEFKLVWQGELWAHVKWSLPGVYNARNAAMAAAACGLALNAVNPRALDIGPLARFRGVKRRQEILHHTPQLTVIEDFGHHPTALAETLQSFRARFPQSVITAAFEPRSNTSRSKAMQAGFMRALTQADEVYLGAVHRADKTKPEERFDPEAVTDNLESQGVPTQWFKTNRELLAALTQQTLPVTKKPRLVVFFTNGSFDGVIGDYVTAAKAASG